MDELEGLKVRMAAVEERIVALEQGFVPKVDPLGAATLVPALAWQRPKASDLPKQWEITAESAFTSQKQLAEQAHDDVDEFWRRAQFGYAPTGERVFSGSRLEYAYNLCDRLVQGKENPDAICAGSGQLPTLVAIVRILTGHFAGGGLLGPPRMLPLKFYPEPNLETVLKGIFFSPLVIE